MSIRPRGRRPAGEDARGAIIAAARTQFATLGYDATTLRGIARAAGVDPRLVHHYFDGKDDVFIAALALPGRPAQLFAPLATCPPAERGVCLVRIFFGAWDRPASREVLVGLLRSMAANPQIAQMMREFVAEHVLRRVIAATDDQEQAALRASLAVAHLFGVAVMRYLVQLEPLASADVDDLAELIAPPLQHYLSPGSGAIFIA